LCIFRERYRQSRRRSVRSLKGRERELFSNQIRPGVRVRVLLTRSVLYNAVLANSPYDPLSGRLLLSGPCAAHLGRRTSCPTHLGRRTSCATDALRRDAIRRTSFVLVASPARLSQSRHRRRRASAALHASRRADRAPPISSCVRRACRRCTCAPCRVRLRASSDITASHPSLLVASPARLSQSRHRRRRVSAEPRASRRVDRALPISSCVRWSYRRRTCAP
jgi:hypothetical protein